MGKKIRFTILSIIIIILGGGVYLSSWRIGLEKAEEMVINGLKEKIGDTVMIERVYGRFFSEIVFEGVKAKGEDNRSLNISKVNLGFSLWSLLRKEPFIKKIVLHTPSLALNRDELGKWIEIESPKMENYLSKGAKIMVKNGVINILDYSQGEDISFKNINGKLCLNRLDVSFDWKDIQIDAKGRINLDKKWVDLELITNEFNVMDIFFANKKLKDRGLIKKLEGLSLITKFCGIISYPDFGVQGRIEFPLLVIRRKEEKVLPHLQANIRYNDRILKIDHLKFGECYTLQGKVDWRKEQPMLDLRITCNKVPVKPFSVLANINERGYHLTGNLWVKGYIDRLRYQGDFTIQDQRSNFKPFNITFIRQGEDIKLEAKQEKGLFVMEGKIYRPRFQFLGFLRDFQIKGFNVDSNFSLQGGERNDSYSINLTLHNFSLNKMKKKIDKIITEISFKNRHFALSSIFSNGYSILCDAKFTTPKEIDIHKLLIRYKERGEINTKGKLNLADHHVRLKGDIKKIGSIPFTGKVFSEFELRDKTLFLKQLEIKSLKETHLSLTGNIGKAFDLRFKVRDGRFSDFVKGWEGNFWFSGKIEGDLDNPRVFGNIFSNSLNIGNKRIESLSGDISYNGDVIKLLSIRLGEGILLKGEVNCLTSKLFGRLYLNKVKNPFPYLPGTYEISGIIDLIGPLSSPHLSGDLSFSSFKFLGVDAEKGRLKFSFENGRFKASEFHIAQKGGYLIINRCEVDFNHKTTKMDGMLKDFQIAKVPLSCNFHFSNNRFVAQDVVLFERYRFKELRTYLNYSGKELAFALDGKSGVTGVVRLQDNVVIDKLEIWKDGVKMGEVSGNVDTKEKTLDIGVMLSDLKFSYSSSPKEEVICFLNSSLHIFGPLNSPNLNGEIFVNGSGHLSFLEDKIRDFSTHILVKDGFFKIARFQARIGKGKLRITSPKDFTLKRLNLEISSDYIKVNLKDFLEGLVKLNLRVSGEYERPYLTGEILFQNTSFTYPYPNIERYGFLRRFAFDIKLIARKNVKYYNDYIKAFIKEKDFLILKGEGRDISVLGKVSSKRGKFKYLGTEFKIQKASLRFQGDEDPYIDIQGKTRIGDTEISLTHNGCLGSKPVLSCLNNPKKTEEELVRLLRYGQVYGSLNENTVDALLRAGIARLVGKGLDSHLLDPIERELGKFLKLDMDLKLPIVENGLKKLIGEKKPEELTELNLGKYITDDLYLIYKGILKEKMELKHELEFQYSLPNGEMIKYRYKPDERHKEHEITIEKEIEF